MRQGVPRSRCRRCRPPTRWREPRHPRPARWSPWRRPISAGRACRARRCAARRSTPVVLAHPRLRLRCTALRRNRCCPQAAAPGRRAPRSSGRRRDWRTALEDTPVRDDRGRCETESGHQHGVAQECVQLAEIVHAALGEIDVRLQRHARRDGRMAHQVGVGRLLAADHHRRHAAADDGVDAVLPGPVAAEDPQPRTRSAPSSMLGELTVDEPRRVGPPDTARRSSGR